MTMIGPTPAEMMCVQLSIEHISACQSVGPAGRRALSMGRQYRVDRRPGNGGLSRINGRGDTHAPRCRRWPRPDLPKALTVIGPAPVRVVADVQVSPVRRGDRRVAVPVGDLRLLRVAGD